MKLLYVLYYYDTPMYMPRHISGLLDTFRRLIQPVSKTGDRLAEKGLDTVIAEFTLQRVGL